MVGYFFTLLRPLNCKSMYILLHGLTNNDRRPNVYWDPAFSCSATKYIKSIKQSLFVHYCYSYHTFHTSYIHHQQLSYSSYSIHLSSTVIIHFIHHTSIINSYHTFHTSYIYHQQLSYSSYIIHLSSTAIIHFIHHTSIIKHIVLASYMHFMTSFISPLSGFIDVSLSI